MKLGLDITVRKFILILIRANKIVAINWTASLFYTIRTYTLKIQKYAHPKNVNIRVHYYFYTILIFVCVYVDYKIFYNKNYKHSI